MKLSLRITTILLILNFTQTHSSSTKTDRQKQIELAFRERYKELKIPKITFNPNKTSCFQDGTRAVFKDYFFNFGDQIVDWIDGKKTMLNAFRDIWKYKAPRHESIINLRENDHHVTMLHEVGHYDLSQKGVNIENRDKLNIGIAVAIMVLWGKHKKKPYKNIITKAGSKCIAAMVLTRVIHKSVERFHETYADNYAFKHVKDKEAVLQTIDQINSKKSKQILDEAGIPLLIQRLICFCGDQHHPSYVSRLAKLQDVLKTRFPD
ncbi:MAG TPA: M48 family metalloprotease [Candidatus Saccharimonadales bacterium]|nr:M48 family metalloprotease [Candidatus Saccharimonadales bacterium]